MQVSIVSAASPAPDAAGRPGACAALVGVGAACGEGSAATSSVLIVAHFTAQRTVEVIAMQGSSSRRFELVVPYSHRGWMRRLVFLPGRDIFLCVLDDPQNIYLFHISHILQGRARKMICEDRLNPGTEYEGSFRPWASFDAFTEVKPPLQHEPCGEWEIKVACGLDGRWTLLLHDPRSRILHVQELHVYRQGLEVRCERAQCVRVGDGVHLKDAQSSILRGISLRADGVAQDWAVEVDMAADLLDESGGDLIVFKDASTDRSPWGALCIDPASVDGLEQRAQVGGGLHSVCSYAPTVRPGLLRWTQAELCLGMVKVPFAFLLPQLSAVVRYVYVADKHFVVVTTAAEQNAVRILRFDTEQLGLRSEIELPNNIRLHDALGVPGGVVLWTDAQILFVSGIDEMLPMDAFRAVPVFADWGSWSCAVRYVAQRLLRAEGDTERASALQWMLRVQCNCYWALCVHCERHSHQIEMRDLHIMLQRPWSTQHSQQRETVDVLSIATEALVTIRRCEESVLGVGPRVCDASRTRKAGIALRRTIARCVAALRETDSARCNELCGVMYESFVNHVRLGLQGGEVVLSLVSPEEAQGHSWEVLCTWLCTHSLPSLALESALWDVAGGPTPTSIAHYLPALMSVRHCLRHDGGKQILAGWGDRVRKMRNAKEGGVLLVLATRASVRSGLDEMLALLNPREPDGWASRIIAAALRRAQLSGSEVARVLALDSEGARLVVSA